MASASTLIKRAPALLRRYRRTSLVTAANNDVVMTARRVTTDRGGTPTVLGTLSSSSWPPAMQIHQLIEQSFSALAQEQEDDDTTPLLPTKHSRKLPPPVCPPFHLRQEVEAIFDAPVGTLIAYSKSRTGELKSAREELSDAYYAADNIVQRVEYILRGLNAMISSESFV